MKYKIVGDSCCDFTQDDLKKEYIVSVPLIIQLGDYEVVDDEKFDQKDFIQRVAEYPEGPKTACPSPEAYMEAFEGADEVYVVTLTSVLSGSYNSAVLAKSLYQEEHPEVKIHVFDSKSAVCGQYLLVKYIEKLIKDNIDFSEVIVQTEAYCKNLSIMFVLDSLEALRKNGRLTNIKAIIANALNIKPVLHGVEGHIEQLTQARGMKKAIIKLVEACVAEKQDTRNMTVAISHCNCPERAEYVKEQLLARIPLQEVIILETRGVGTVYASDGGIVVAY